MQRNTGTRVQTTTTQETNVGALPLSCGYYVRMRESIEKYVSAPRFGRYMDSCGGDFGKALALYEANMRLSGAAMEAINIVEVTLRNAMDEQLRSWNRDRINNEEWTTLPAAHLANVINQGKNLPKAREKAEKALAGKRSPVHDDVVAQLSFGTWFFMLPSSGDDRDSKKRIWDSSLKDAFPMRHNVPVSKIKESIGIIYDLRNRVAHFEPIYSLHLEGKRSSMAKILHVIDRPIKKWFSETERFTSEVERFRAEWPELTK
nr:Abi family protein [Leucobacter luti]